MNRRRPNKYSASLIVLCGLMYVSANTLDLCHYVHRAHSEECYLYLKCIIKMPYINDSCGHTAHPHRWQPDLPGSPEGDCVCRCLTDVIYTIPSRFCSLFTFLTFPPQTSSHAYGPNSFFICYYPWRTQWHVKQRLYVAPGTSCTLRVFLAKSTAAT